MLERDDPYPHPGASREGLRAVRHVQDVLFLPPHDSPLGNAAIKWAVTTHGAVDATMAYEHSDFNAATSAYYSRGTDLDHHVCIVGWDDGYPAGRFLRRPPGPGRVPHQEQLGHDLRAGRLLLDLLLRPLLGTTLPCSRASRARPTTTPSTSTTPSAGRRASASTTAHGVVRRAVHERRRRQRHRRELLHGRAGRDLRGPGRAVARRASPAAPVAGSGTLDVGGYHTVDLTTPFPVTDGADFVVAVRLTTPGSLHAHPGGAPDEAAGAAARRRALVHQPRRRGVEGPARQARASAPPTSASRPSSTRPARRDEAAAPGAARTGRGPPGRGDARPLHAHRPGVLQRQRRGQALAARRAAAACCVNCVSLP